MRYGTFREWEDACYLQYTVYMPFVNHLRQEYDYDNDSILALMSNKPETYERLMKEYYRNYVQGRDV
jgi:hypothetical protein